MGRHHSMEEQTATVTWATSFRGAGPCSIQSPAISAIVIAHEVTLKNYFALSALSRSKSAPRHLVESAYQEVFRVRLAVEQDVRQSVLASLREARIALRDLFIGKYFGASKKQGVSLRMPLWTCIPTRACAAACYAHDVLDAAPGAVVRGVINGVIAETYETGSPSERRYVLAHLEMHTRNAIREALKEVSLLPDGWTRRANIRFSHIGEIAAYPDFANALAQQVTELSEGAVDSVVYTRHRKVSELDTSLMVVNFTLDETSEDRRAWISPGCRAVYSAFGGRLSQEAEVNFLEHHRWSHTEPVGTGAICPATLPETKVRACDAVGCDRCFRFPENSDHIRGEQYEQAKAW